MPDGFSASLRWCPAWFSWRLSASPLLPTQAELISENGNVTALTIKFDEDKNNDTSDGELRLRQTTGNRQVDVDLVVVVF